MNPTRDLPKIGVKFSILIPARYNAQVFTGVCIANGCDYVMACQIANDLDKHGTRLTTIRPLKDWETFIRACKMIGVHVEEIPPL